MRIPRHYTFKTMCLFSLKANHLADQEVEAQRCYRGTWSSKKHVRLSTTADAFAFLILEREFQFPVTYTLFANYQASYVDHFSTFLASLVCCRRLKGLSFPLQPSSSTPYRIYSIYSLGSTSSCDEKLTSCSLWLSLR